MAEKTPQTYANHSRLDPVYHFFIFPVSAVTVLLSGWSLVQYGVSLLAVWSVVATIAACLAVLVMRTYAMKVQDRVIRLEERLRLATLLSDPLKARIGELTVSQLIALRFASDGEIPALVEKTLNDKLTNPQIKKQIANWRPDYHRV